MPSDQNSDTHENVMRAATDSASDQDVQNALNQPAPTLVDARVDALHDRFSAFVQEFRTRMAQVEQVVGIGEPVLNEIGSVVSMAVPGAAPVVAVVRDILSELRNAFGSKLNLPHPSVLGTAPGAAVPVSQK